jgi:uncharacterized membrane protein YhaH (DUF805 family)
MRGVVSGIVPDGTYGQIAAEDGQRYSYWSSEVRNGQMKVGQTVEFQMWEGQPIDIFVVNNPPLQNAAPPQRSAQPQQRTFASATPAAHNSVPGSSAAAPAGYAAAVSAAGAIPSSRDYWIKLFTSPSGRISRRQFWLHGVLPIVVGNIVLAWIPVIGQIVSLVLLWGSICIGFKRFHDLGYPGWYSLIYFVPLVAAAVVFTIGMVVVRFLDLAWLLAEVLGGISFLIALAQLIFVYVRVGQEGPNEYGPDPLAL